MLNLISFIMLCVGGINWLSIGLVQFDLFAGIFGSQANIFSRLIYIIVGICALYLIFKVIKKKGTLEMKFSSRKRKKDLLSDVA